MQPHSYQIVIDLTIKDMEYFLYSQYTKKLSAKIFIGIAALMGLMTLYILITTQDMRVMQGFILPLVIFIGLPWSIKSQAKKLFESSNGQFKNNNYTFEEDGLTIVNANSNTKLTWDMIFKLEENKQQVLLFVNNAVAHVLPKRYFKTEAELQQFLQLVRTKTNSPS